MLVSPPTLSPELVQRFMRRALRAAQFLDRLADGPPQADAARVATLDHRLLMTRRFTHRPLAMITDHEPRGTDDIGIWIEMCVLFGHEQYLSVRFDVIALPESKEPQTGGGSFFMMAQLTGDSFDT